MKMEKDIKTELLVMRKEDILMRKEEIIENLYTGLKSTEVGVNPPARYCD